MMRSFGMLRYDEMETTPTPVGKLCLWCVESIAERESGFILTCGSIYHRECFVRTIIGSVAHVQRRCSCFVVGGVETDPPELTRRQAARLAVELFEESDRDE